MVAFPKEMRDNLAQHTPKSRFGRVPFWQPAVRQVNFWRFPVRRLSPLALIACSIPLAATDGKLLYEQDFAKPECVKQFVFSDPAAWKYGGGALELAYDKGKYKSSYNPKHRSPIHIALVADRVFTDFTLDCELMSTIPAYGHQDVCLFFGFEAPQKYYYVHIARAADMNAHNVFIVNDAPRTNIAKETTKGVDWKADTWHKVRLVRDTKAGTIEVYFDDFAKPVMKAEDRTFAKGHVGFGSFDDTMKVRNVRVTGPAAEVLTGPPAFFKPLGK
jgi:hypothetical protein